MAIMSSILLGVIKFQKLYIFFVIVFMSNIYVCVYVSTSIVYCMFLCLSHMFVCVMSSFGFNEHVAISIVIKYVSDNMVYDV